MGSNHYGQLGLGDVSLNHTWEPRLVESLMNEKIVFVTCGNNHNVAISDKGEVYSWGFGESGALGTGDTKNQYSPTLINHFYNGKMKIVSASCGDKHTAFLSRISVIKIR